MTAGQRWSTEKPKEAGWYWWRLAPGHYPIIEEYKRDAEGNLVMYVECNGELLKFPLAPGEWQGPITPNNDHLADLRKLVTPNEEA